MSNSKSNEPAPIIPLNPPVLAGSRPSEPMPDHPPPSIPDQELIACIGRGSYGEVWLSRSETGVLRAVKIIYRDRFDRDRPFDREFEGLQAFEKVCLTHPGLVALLQVGRNREGGYFFYVMELADDLHTGPQIDPDTYGPKTLRNMLSDRGRLPVSECLALGDTLAGSLAHLHRHGLLHRDIKPSNIIFAQGVPKFADIGLVTALDEPMSWVGTPPYTPPERPAGITFDLYSLGRVLYETATGLPQERFPELPAELIDGPDGAVLLRLNRVIIRCCTTDNQMRYHCAEEMHIDLLRTIALQHTFTPDAPASPNGRNGPCVSLIFKANARLDYSVASILKAGLAQKGFHVLTDKHQSQGLEWLRDMETACRKSAAVVLLLSTESAVSDVLAYNAELARQTAASHHGRPQLIPVRLQGAQSLPVALRHLAQSHPGFSIAGETELPGLLDSLFKELRDQVENDSTYHNSPPDEGPSGGAVPLHSKYYIERAADHEFNDAIGRKDSIVLVKGARQMGKTSLLARGAQYARERGAKVALTDFQKLDSKHLASAESLFLKLGDFLADQLNLQTLPNDTWDPRRSANTNFERYLRRHVLGSLPGHLVWCLDEMDRVFGCPFSSEFFGLLRSWHNERALDPDGPWSRLTLAIAYATEAHLFISDINQSPFNVGTRLRLDDFDFDQVRELNRRYGEPLTDPEQVREFHQLLGGQPYLVRHALSHLASKKLTFEDFKRHADAEEGIFSDHLRRILILLHKEPKLSDVVKGILQGQPCRDAGVFYRLRSAGLMAGDCPEQVRPRCQIYENYLKRNLLGAR